VCISHCCPDRHLEAGAIMLVFAKNYRYAIVFVSPQGSLIEVSHKNERIIWCTRTETRRKYYGPKCQSHHAIGQFRHSSKPSLVRLFRSSDKFQANYTVIPALYTSWLGSLSIWHTRLKCWCQTYLYTNISIGTKTCHTIFVTWVCNSLSLLEFHTAQLAVVVKFNKVKCRVIIEVVKTHLFFVVHHSSRINKPIILLLTLRFAHNFARKYCTVSLGSNSTLKEELLNVREHSPSSSLFLLSCTKISIFTLCWEGSVMEGKELVEEDVSFKVFIWQRQSFRKR